MKFNDEQFLTPTDTQISIEAWLRDTTNILSPNSLGEYRFGFVPINPHDYFRVEELVDSALRRASHHRNIGMEDKTQSNGVLICNQLFAPKLNREFEYEGQIARCDDPVSLNLHLRDDRYGNIYLQCSYCDFYEMPEREVVEPPEGYDINDDF